MCDGKYSTVTKQCIFQRLNAPIEFQEYHLSEVQPNTSVSLERVQKSLNKNGVALKGVINVPEFGRAGELLSLNQKFRNSLDLYANVCKVESLPGVKSRHKNVDLIICNKYTTHPPSWILKKTDFDERLKTLSQLRLDVRS